MNYYLICDKCGHPNLCDSETLLFCEKCNRKIENNFNSYAKRFPHKTFVEFQTECCATNIVAQDSHNNNKYQKIKPVTAYIVATLTMLASTIILFISIKSYRNSVSNEQYLLIEKNFSNWQEYRFDSAGIALLLPFKPDKITFLYNNIPSEYQGYITGLETYTKNFDPYFSFMLNAVTYYDTVNVNLETSAKTILSEVQSIEGIENMQFSYSSIEINKCDQSIYISGSFSDNGNIQQFRIVVFSKSRLLVQVLIIFDEKLTIIEPQVKKIFENIKIIK